jgi:structural maintenance of chromosomes protein 5
MKAWGDVLIGNLLVSCCHLHSRLGYLTLICSRLMEMESKNSKLLQALQMIGADKITEAYHWVQDNKKNFRGEVYGPVLLEVCFTFAVNSPFICSQDTILWFNCSQVNVEDKLHATYLENHVPNYIWKVQIEC